MGKRTPLLGALAQPLIAVGMGQTPLKKVITTSYTAAATLALAK